MKFHVIGERLTPAEGEIIVRSYHCTNLSPVFALIGLKTDGYMTVTNKRVVYYAQGSSAFGAAGKSSLYSEVPIADVSNIALGQGTRFSLLRLLCAVLVGNIPAAIVTAIILSVMTGFAGISGGSNPYLLRLAVFLQLGVASLLVFQSVNISRQSIVRFMLAASSLSLVLSIPALSLSLGGAGHPLPAIYQKGMAILSIPLACYWLWCLYFFIRRQYLTMRISSRGGFSTPIEIKAVSFWGRTNHAAELAAGMAPAIDAAAMFKELGAMVTDIQTLGDHGIKKWQQVDDGALEEAAHQAQREDGCRWPVTRRALISVATLVLLVGGESLWYASGGKERLASQMRTELAALKDAANKDSAPKEWAPKLLTLAQEEATAGENAFKQRKFTDAMAHWRGAMDKFAKIPGTVAALKEASALKSEYRAAEASVYLQEAASARLKSAFLMNAFTALVEQHPITNEPWRVVRLSVDEARGLDVREKWRQTGAAWEQADENLPKAASLMHADLWVKMGEEAIRKNDARAALTFLENALNEVPGYADALQRRALAMNMIQFARLIEVSGEGDAGGSVAQLNATGGEDWRLVQTFAEKASALASKDQWTTCNEEWEKALAKMPAVILAVRVTRLEMAARRGNWTTVSIVASKILQDNPGHLRATALRIKADGIKSADASEFAYQQAMSKTLDQEAAGGRIQAGDMTDFIAHMDAYGQEEWIQVKDSIAKAEEFRANEQGAESRAEWAKASTLFPEAVKSMRAEIWMEHADLAVKNGNWANALVFAENALKIKPQHVRAMQVRDQADAIVEKLPSIEAVTPVAAGDRSGGAPVGLGEDKNLPLKPGREASKQEMAPPAPPSKQKLDGLAQLLVGTWRDENSVATYSEDGSVRAELHSGQRWEGTWSISGRYLIVRTGSQTHQALITTLDQNSLNTEESDGLAWHAKRVVSAAK